MFHYRKTKPGSANLTRSSAVYPVKTFKDSSSFFRRDADAAILDLN
jgi:hypothetical protein